MDWVTESEDIPWPIASLWIVFSTPSYSACFELDGQRRREIHIGAHADADIRLIGTRAAAVECRLEREGDEIWLVPASAASVIGVDSVAVHRPIRLWRRTAVTIAGVAFDIRIREEPPTAPDCELPVQHGRTEIPFDTRHEESHISSAARRASKSAPTGSGVTPQKRELGRHVVERNPNSVTSRHPPPASPTGAWPDGARAAATIQPGSGGPIGDWTDAPPSSMAPAMVSVRVLSRAPAVGLEQLGVLTRRRPLLVAFAGTIGAAALAIALHWTAGAVQITGRPVPAAMLERAAPLAKLVTPCAENEVTGEPSSGTLEHRGSFGIEFPIGSLGSREYWSGWAKRHGYEEALRAPAILVYPIGEAPLPPPSSHDK